MAPFTKLEGVILKFIKSFIVVILVVTPDVILSIAFPDESVVEIWNDDVVAVVLGFLSPSNVRVKGVPVLV